MVSTYFCRVFLRRLTLFNFKNYSEAEFSFSEGANALTGPNGSGKTNVLDAIHYLCLCKSYFGMGDRMAVRHEAGFFSISGTFSVDEGEEDILVTFRQGQKKSVKRNHREYSRLGDHIGLLPLVMEAPVDQQIIHGSSEERRRFMDPIICQYDHKYLDALMNYNRVLQQRNAFLKQAGHANPDVTMREVWDEQLCALGTVIHEARRKFISSFTGIFTRYYDFLSGEKERAEITYTSHLDQKTMQQVLGENLHKDTVMQFTTAGVHRDDLQLLMDGHPVRKLGSQGQQKCVVLALKLAQFQMIRDARGIKPILMLDDIYDKLDAFRITRLMELVSQETFGQIFLTDTNEEHVSGIFKKLDIPLQVFPVNR